MAEPKYEIVNDERIDAIKDNFTPPGAEKKKTVDWNKPLFEVDEENGVLKTPTRKKPKKFRKRNWNDIIGVVDEETGTFQKSLDDYMTKNKKGRDDIPVTTRR